MQCQRPAGRIVDADDLHIAETDDQLTDTRTVHLHRRPPSNWCASRPILRPHPRPGRGEPWRFGESAIHTALDVLAGSEAGFPETVAAWSRLAEDLSIGERYDALTCALLSDSPREAVLDAPARNRLAVAARQRSTDDKAGELTGVLYEANFEKCTGHLRTPDGEAVRVRFDDERANEIKEALRESSRLEGQITYTDEAADVVSVESIEIVQPQRLELGTAIDDFWTTRSLVELAEAQSVDVVVDVETLQDESVSDEEAEAFIRALGL